MGQLVHRDGSRRHALKQKLSLLITRFNVTEGVLFFRIKAYHGSASLRLSDGSHGTTDFHQEKIIKRRLTRRSDLRVLDIQCSRVYVQFGCRV